MTIRELLGLHNASDKPVGVEIEVESDNVIPRLTGGTSDWVEKMDGSLRGVSNREYVFKEPLGMEESFKAIDDLSNFFRDESVQVTDSVRASTHIHINVLDMSVEELRTFMTCWFILEEPTIDRLCGIGRKGNHFCLSAKDSELSSLNFNKMTRRGILHDVPVNHLKYSATNFASVINIGSVEFRAMRTTTNTSKVKALIKLLLTVKENSLLFHSPGNVIEQFSIGGEINFLRQMTGDLSKLFEPFDRNLVKSLRNGTRTAQEIAFF